MPIKTYTPGEVEELTGWTAMGQRDLRAKGYLDNYGSTTGGGRFRFAGRDVMAFWIARAVQDMMRSDGAVNLRSAFAIAWSNSPTVIDCIRGTPPERCITAFLITYSRESGEIAGSELVQFRSTADLEFKNFDKAVIYDWKKFSADVPSRITDVARAA